MWFLGLFARTDWLLAGCGVGRCSLDIATRGRGRLPEVKKGGAGVARAAMMWYKHSISEKNF